MDDDALTLRALSRILSDYPDQRLATSGEQALHLARASVPDLFLIDMQMPNMSGTQLCAAIKNDPLLAHVPVLFATSDDSEATRLEALRLGASDFFVKPVQPDQLLARVAAALRQAARLKYAINEAATALPASAFHGGPSRILVVDDDEGAVQMLRHTLQDVGEIRAVINGRAALELVQAWQPDLILVDASMPGMDGFELCARLRDKAELRHAAIVFVTRLGEAEHETRALELGASDFITKPYSRAVLQARVRNLLDLKRNADLELAAVVARGQRLTAERLAAVVESASDAIVTIDAAGDVVLMNAAAGHLLGTDHRTAPGMPAVALLTPRYPDLPLTTPVPPLRALLQRQDADPLPTEVSISVVGEGLQRLATLMIRDLSDRERLAAEAQARAAAEAANQTKAMMISFVSHEINNPLNCIAGFAQLLKMDIASMTATQAHRLQMIETGCTQLGMLIKDLSALGQFELGRLAINSRSLDVSVVIDEALQTAEALAHQIGIQLVSPGNAPRPALALADDHRLRQCLINLISNGIKYNRQNGSVTVSTEVEPRRVLITVADTGRGMSTVQLGQLFEPFNRLGRQSSAVPGSGLGLVVTKMLIEAMGGQLSVSSELDVGTRFTICLSTPQDQSGDDGSTTVPGQAS